MEEESDESTEEEEVIGAGRGESEIARLIRGMNWALVNSGAKRFCPLPSNRQYLSSDACLEVKREDITRIAPCCVVYDTCAQ